MTLVLPPHVRALAHPAESINEKRRRMALKNMTV
jgi:hypothetical protein